MYLNPVELLRNNHPLLLVGIVIVFKEIDHELKNIHSSKNRKPHNYQIKHCIFL
jgi:hypothetical protein